jgi:DNA-binding NarL/FixJ family response regulator
MSYREEAPGETEIGVLICDDTEAMRTLLRVIIELRPTMRVVGEATDGIEAVREATRLQPEVILLDLAMPLKTGLEAMPEIRNGAPDAQIIVLTGFAAANAAEEALALGAARYIEKTASAETIVDAIEAVAAAPARQDSLRISAER